MKVVQKVLSVCYVGDQGCLEKRELLGKWNIWDSAHTATNHKWNEQVEGDNKVNEHRTTNVRICYIRVAYGDSFPNCKGKDAIETHRGLLQTYGEKCIDVLNVQRWKRDFENNHRVSLQDECHSRVLADCLSVDNIGCGWSTIDVWRGVWWCMHVKLTPLTPHPLARDRHNGPASGWGGLHRTSGGASVVFVFPSLSKGMLTVSLFIQHGWSIIHTIIHNVLELQKLSCRWVPHILTDNHISDAN